MKIHRALAGVAVLAAPVIANAQPTRASAPCGKTHEIGSKHRTADSAFDQAVLLFVPEYPDCIATMLQLASDTDGRWHVPPPAQVANRYW